MLKKYYIILLIFTLSALPCIAQVQEINLLLKKVKTTKDLKEKADTYNRIAILSHFRYRDSCLIYASKAFEVSDSLGYDKGTADALNCLGIYYMSSNNYLSAKYLNNALSIYKEIDDRENEAQIYMNLSVLFFSDKNQKEAVRYIYKADKLISTIKKDSIRSIILSDILTIDKNLKPENRNKIFAQGYAIAKKYNDYPMIVSYENNRGTHLYNMGKREEGLKILLESVKMADSIGCEYVKVSAYITLGEMMFDLGREQEGIHFYELGIDASQHFGYPERFQVFSERLFSHYKSKNNSAQAFKYANLLLEKQLELKKKNQESGYNYVNYVSKEIENNKLKKVQEYQTKAFIGLSVLIVLLTSFLFILWKLYRSKKDFARIQQQLHDASEQRNNELEDRDGFNSMLISVLAHDVRQPFLNIIMAASLFQQEENLSEEEKLFIIKELDLTAKHSIFFMDGILAWIQSRKLGHAFNKEIIDVNDLVLESNSFFTTVQKEKEINLIVSIEKNLIVDTNRMILAFVLRNLFNNATKYSPIGSSIEIAAIVKTTEIILSIKDNGRGMTKEQILQLFQTTKDTTNLLPDKGAGIALAMSYEMLLQVGVRLSVESTVNEGSTFFINIPLGNSLS